MYYDYFYSVKLFRLAGGACADCWQQVGSGVPSRRKASIKRLFYLAIQSFTASSADS